jgi:hypothetical protein
MLFKVCISSLSVLFLFSSCKSTGVSNGDQGSEKFAKTDSPEALVESYANTTGTDKTPPVVKFIFPTKLVPPPAGWVPVNDPYVHIPRDAFTFTVDATDPGSGVKSVTCEYGFPAGPRFMKILTTAPYTIKWTEGSPPGTSSKIGLANLWCGIRDNAGNESLLIQTVRIVIVPKAPSNGNDGSSCTKPADCKSSVCSKGICQAATCKDKVKNGLESDIDCGGAVCNGCPTFHHCNTKADCVAPKNEKRLCTDGICCPPSGCKQ